jgi:hypothetical protein
MAKACSGRSLGSKNAMDRGRAFVNSQEVVVSGTLVVQPEQPVEIYPFADDLEYQISVKFDFGKGNKRSIRAEPSDKGMALTMSREFEPDLSFGSTKGLNFSSDDNFEYYLSVTAQIIGTSERYSIIFTYTLTKEEKA